MDGANKPRAGDIVVLITVPPGLVDGLPDEDQRAINAIVGKPVMLVGYDGDGRAELEFPDPFDGKPGSYSHTHTIWVSPEFIEAYQP